MSVCPELALDGAPGHPAATRKPFLSHCLNNFQVNIHTWVFSGGHREPRELI